MALPSMPMVDILGLNSLFAEMVLGLGLALVLGNAYAWWKHRQGDKPTGVEGEYRPGRVRFLIAVGVLMTMWGAASMLRF